MITRAQELAVERVNPAALPTLHKMWEQRRIWWFAYYGGRPAGEAQAAARAAKLHAELLDRAPLPELLVSGWEREWDDWFEKNVPRVVEDRRG